MIMVRDTVALGQLGRNGHRFCPGPVLQGSAFVADALLPSLTQVSYLILTGPYR